jgi:hypothetical protein
LKFNWPLSFVRQRRTIQLTDGGPSVTPEFSCGVAGPSFGEAPGSAFCSNQEEAWEEKEEFASGKQSWNPVFLGIV